MNKNITLFTFFKQQQGGYIIGTELRKLLKGEKVASYADLWNLYKHPENIPKEWKQRTEGEMTFISFWGSVGYRNGRVEVPYMYWLRQKGRWEIDWAWIEFGWGKGDKIAIIKP